jgi:hypothetical protein
MARAFSAGISYDFEINREGAAHYVATALHFNRRMIFVLEGASAPNLSFGFYA